MKSDFWYYTQAAKKIGVKASTVKEYCKRYRYSPSVFYELVKSNSFIKDYDTDIDSIKINRWKK